MGAQSHAAQAHFVDIPLWPRISLLPNLPMGGCHWARRCTVTAALACCGRRLCGSAARQCRASVKGCRCEGAAAMRCYLVLLPTPPPHPPCHSASPHAAAKVRRQLPLLETAAIGVTLGPPCGIPCTPQTHAGWHCGHDSRRAAHLHRAACAGLWRPGSAGPVW